MDGNFKGRHNKIPNPEADVWLEDGSGFMVTKGPYEEHLAIAKESYHMDKPPCKKLKNAGVGQDDNDLHETGIGMCACARHGCFIPHSGVGYQRGEKSVPWLPRE